jgi:hypothetical protein
MAERDQPPFFQKQKHQEKNIYCSGEFSKTYFSCGYRIGLKFHTPYLTWSFDQHADVQIMCFAFKQNLKLITNFNDLTFTIKVILGLIINVILSI